MKLAEAIHAHWADANELTALLPAARFFTGAPPAAELPWASLVGWRAEAVERFHDKTGLERVEATVEIHSAQFHHACTTAEAVRRRFDRAALLLEGNDRALACRCTAENARCESWGHWVFAITLELLVHRSGD